MAVPPSAPQPRASFHLRRHTPCPQCSWGMEEKAAASAGCREPPGPPRAAAVAYFGISVDPDDILPGALSLIQELRPHWKPEQVRTKRFTDGITNKLVACYVEEDMQDCVLVRVYGERTELLVDRENEVRNFQLLRAHGCAPRLYCTFQNGLCYEYMQGVALGPEHIREPRLFRLIALEMAKIHTIHANGSLPKPTLWHKMHNYFTLVKNEINPSLSADVPKVEVLERELAWLKEHLSQLESPVVFCHNDLLCKNIIYDSIKGMAFLAPGHCGFFHHARDELVVLGWQLEGYGGAGRNQSHPIPTCVWPASPSGVNEVDYCLYPARETQLQWLHYYLQAQKGMAVTPREVERLYVQVNKFALASHFFWALWALIQNQYSTIHFDFLRYAVIRFNQYFKVKPQVSALEMPK
ncbi:PREDICTED: ethanolamine kinase 2 [Colobus angolensis palliatus]|uniref:ethanolamine kinase 2 n=1 Tax=Colobus angolensis palliatus TaxID=336983 RepID=UPI0005F48462|nr:PREDICTED: ethanolamine kinase 2 [Colobus angolensis palliatus]